MPAVAAVAAAAIMGTTQPSKSLAWVAYLGGPLLALSIALSLYRRQLLDGRAGRLLALQLDLQATLELLRSPQKKPFTVVLPHEAIQAHLFTIDAPAIGRAAEHADLDDNGFRVLLMLHSSIGSYNRRMAAFLGAIGVGGGFNVGSNETLGQNLSSLFIGPLVEMQGDIEWMAEDLLGKLG